MAAWGVLAKFYKDLPYQKRDIQKVKIYDSCYVFNIADDFRFIASRAPYCEKYIGDSVYDIMDVDDIEEMRDHLTSYNMRPMAVVTSRGIALALPYLVPSCSLGMLAFPIAGGIEFARAAKICEWDIVFSQKIKEMQLRRSHQSVEHEEEFSYYLDLITATFGGLYNSKAFQGDITRQLEQRIYSLSEYIGCPIGLKCEEPIIAVGELDVAFMIAYFTVAMMSARWISPRREAGIIFEPFKRGTAFAFFFMSDGESLRDVSELYEFKRIADRYYMYFESRANEVMLYVKFVPMRIDWGLLGYKSPNADIALESDILDIEKML